METITPKNQKRKTLTKRDWRELYCLALTLGVTDIHSLSELVEIFRSN
jgi:hypothetical protein